MAVLSAFSTLWWPIALSAGEPSEPAIAVIVSPSLAAPLPMNQTVLIGVFRRKRQLWDDHTPIAPVNMPAGHALRRNFSLWLFKRSPEDLQAYWNDQYFHGVLPPPVLASEEAVIRFVASTPGAIGYVSVCSVDKRVQVAALLQGPDGAAPCPR